MIDQDLESAHSHCAIHEQEVRASAICGCFYCLAMFPPGDIDTWINDRFVDGRTGKTALCPKCGIDSVIGNCSGFPITEDFLKRMYMRWFGT